MKLPPITAIQDELTDRWHAEQSAGAASRLEALVIRQHRQNFDLWHHEDRARAPLASAEQIALTKREIDAVNQIRNDLVEAIDRELLGDLDRAGVKLGGELHSETPGMIIDRLSILSLKIFHTREQVARQDTTAEHLARSRERLEILLQQQNDLAACLMALWGQVHNGTRYFKVYRQLKMYNDPDLNPEIYSSRVSR
jgi:hypothetical protein